MRPPKTERLHQKGGKYNCDCTHVRGHGGNGESVIFWSRSICGKCDPGCSHGPPGHIGLNHGSGKEGFVATPKLVSEMVRAVGTVKVTDMLALVDVISVVVVSRCSAFQSMMPASS